MEGVQKDDMAVASMEGDETATAEQATAGNTSGTLWEQMTAREGKDAAHRAGMRAGDWQAERQLQTALRESRREAGTTTGGAVDDTNGSDENFVDAGFHALSTSAVEGEEDEPEQHAINDSSNSSSNNSARGGSAAAVPRSRLEGTLQRKLAGHRHAKGNDRTSGKTGAKDDARGGGAVRGGGEKLGVEADEEEEEEALEELELVVTQDGGIVALNAIASAGGEEGSAAPCVATAPRRRAAAARALRNDDNARRVEGSVRGSAAGGVSDVRASLKSSCPRSDEQRRKLVDGRVGDEKRAQVGREPTVEETCGGGQEEEEGDEGGGEEEGGEEPLPPDIMLTLHDDVLHRTMLFLQPEDIFECRAVTSRWEFPGHEAVFEGLCRRTYLAQSAKKLLNVRRWRSWQRMFKLRPRLRDTGLYSLKTTYFKKPVRDMSTTWVPGQILEVTYYRYFRFFGDGRVAYGLTHEAPKEFVKMLQEGSPKVVYGTYTIRKWDVAVEIPTPWSTVDFTLQLANGERGRFTHLVMLRHSSVPRNDPRAGRCHHSVKSSDFFTFRRVWQF